MASFLTKVNNFSFKTRYWMMFESRKIVKKVVTSFAFEVRLWNVTFIIVSVIFKGHSGPPFYQLCCSPPKMGNNIIEWPAEPSMNSIQSRGCAKKILIFVRRCFIKNLHY